MSVQNLLPFFEERFKEVEAYLDLLGQLEKAAQSGPPRLVGADSPITAPQQKILYSSVYLQLYNLVEATVSRCVEAVSSAAEAEGRWRPEHLNIALQQEWVRAVARTHVEMTPENRLKQAVEMSRHLIDQLPINGFSIDIGGGGNWDDQAIEKIGNRIGCSLKISPSTRVAVKRPFRDDLGALKLVKNRRNSLAHGSISFVDCADGVAVTELRDLTQAIGAYLREVIDCFIRYISTFDFLASDHKPTGVM
jgi:hypothetical protein